MCAPKPLMADALYRLGFPAVGTAKRVALAEAGIYPTSETDHD